MRCLYGVDRYFFLLSGVWCNVGEAGRFSIVPSCRGAGITYCLKFIARTVSTGFTPLLFLGFRGSCSVSLNGVTLVSAFFFFARLLISLFYTGFMSQVNCHMYVMASRVYTTTKLIKLTFLPSLLPGPFAKVVVDMVVCTIKDKLVRILYDPVVRTYPFGGGRTAVDLLRSFCY